MQNFGNYNVNPNTPIYVGGGKKKVKKQSEDKSLGEKVAIGVASTAGAIAAILIGYGIINKFTGNTTKITKDAKEAATAVLPKAKDAGKKLLPPNKSGDQNVRTILKNLNKIKDGSLTYDQAIKMKQSLQVLCKNGSVSDVKLNGIDLAPFFNHLLLYLSTITQNGKDNFKCDTSNKELLCNEGANFWTRIKTIDNVNKFLGNFQLIDVEVDDKEAKLSLKKNSTIKDISNLNFDQNPKTSDLIELCKGFYISKGDINDDSKLYIKDQEGKFAEITLRQLKENLNPVVTIEHPIEDLNDIKQFDTLAIVNGQEGENTELYLTGLKKEGEKNIYSIKVSALLANTALLKQLIKNLNITPEIFAEVIKTAEASILYQLMNDGDLKAKLVENNKLTEVGKKIVGAAIKGGNEQEKATSMATMLKELDLKEEVGAAVVDYLIGRDDVTAGMLNQVMKNGDLKAKLVDQNEGDNKGKLTAVGQKIVDAAIRDKGAVDSGKIAEMLKGLDLKEEVGAAVVDHLLGRGDVTADMLNQVMTNADLKSKLVTKGEFPTLTAAGEKIMKKAIDKHISLSALKVLAQTLGIKKFSYTIPNTQITLEIGASSQLLIINYAQYVYGYIKECGANGTEVADGDRLLFRSILKNEKTYNKYFETDGKFKDSNGVFFVQDDFKPEYTTQQHKYEDFKSVEYLKNVASNWAACQDQLALNLSAPTTLGQVFKSASSDAALRNKLIKDGTPPTLTSAGEAIVEAAITHNTTDLDQNAKDKKQQENIVELLSNFNSFDENIVGAAVIDYLMDHGDVTADMLGQALKDSKLKDKFFQETPNGGTTIYSLTEAGQHMIKQAAKTYNNNNDNNSFSRFLKNLNVANYFNVIYDILAKNEDNYISSQACWFLQILISDTSVSEEDKKVLHEIIKNKCINDFNLNDHSDTCYTNQNRDLTISGISELILFANSQSNVFIGAAETTTSDVLKNLKKKKEFTITINNVKFKYIIDETNHKVYYRQK